MTSALREKTIYQPFFPKLWQLGRAYARGPMEKGLRQGPWTFWYLSGAKQMEGSYLNGKKTGSWIKYWENGKPQSRGEFIHGRMHGTWIDFYPNGNKAQESDWDMGKSTGPARLFDRETGEALAPRPVPPGPEPDGGYTLLSDRDVSLAVRRAARASVNRSWKGLVGQRIGSLVEPWQAAFWLLLLPVFYHFFDGYGFSYWSIPAAFVAASLAGVGLTVLSLVHDHFTRPDIGT